MVETTCCKCEDPFMDPRILPCLHSFCLKCLQKLSESTLQCPICDEVVPLPSSGVQALPKDHCSAYEAKIAILEQKIENGKEKCEYYAKTDGNEAIAFCVQCNQFLCKECQDHHKKISKSSDHDILPTGERLSKVSESSAVNKYCLQPFFCSAHADEKLKYYCQECKKLICRDCIGSKLHKVHSAKCILVDEAADEEMESLKNSLSPSQAAVTKLDNAIDSCREITEKVKSRKEEVDEMITSSLERVQKTLLDKNKTICDGKVSTLEIQERELAHIRDGLAHALALIKDLSNYMPDQQLSTKDVISTRVDLLLNQFQSADLIPLENDTLLTQVDQESTIAEMIALCHLTEGVHAASSTFESDIPPRVFAGRECTMEIMARDREGKPLHCSGEKPEVRLEAPHGGGVECKCFANSNGTYTAQYIPRSAGQHKLHVAISGQPIKASPLTFTVNQCRPYATLTCQHGFSTNNNPYDIAIVDDGSLAVAECKSHTVSIYSKCSGQDAYPPIAMCDERTQHLAFPLGTGIAGHSSKQLDSPMGVAVRGDILYVAEQGYQRIKTFSLSLREELTTFGEGKFISPRGISLDLEGNVFVADYGNNCIQVFKPDGSFHYSITADPANAETQFKNPWGIAFDNRGNLHIAANRCDSIKVYSPMGKYITTYGSGTISRPAGIAINGEGVIAISEHRGSNRLWIYDYDQTTLLNTIQGVFSCAMGIACDADDVFWVVDYNQNCVYKF